MNVKRFLSRIDKTDSCWLWTAGRTAGGYGRFHVDGGDPYAHRLSYELFVGPIPDGLQIDHLCRVRHCVNPEHLEAVTPAENVRRGYGPAAISGRTGLCKRGHPLSEAGPTRPSTGGRRYCVTCRNMRNAARYTRAAA